jgi:hypothetical protein
MIKNNMLISITMVLFMEDEDVEKRMENKTRETNRERERVFFPCAPFG